MLQSTKPIAINQLNLSPNAYILDIETTGFSPKFSSIYMVGLIYLKDNRLLAEQWLCQKPEDEYELLFKLQSFMDENPLLYHFNGDQFDMPFIIKRMGLYGLKCPPYRSYDLMKVLRPFKNLFALENLKLKTVESYFGYDRHDPYTGGDLIKVYKNYLLNPTKKDETDLLTHNYEDILGLATVLVHVPLFQLLDDFKSGDQTIVLHQATLDKGQYTGKFTIPSLIGHHLLKHHLFTLTLEAEEAILSMTIVDGPLYFFFPDPKNYYFLPNEGYAIHKSIGQYVDKTHRLQALKDTAYVPKEGYFLPATRAWANQLPLYYHLEDRKQAYVAIEDLVSANAFELYLKDLLKHL